MIKLNDQQLAAIKGAEKHKYISAGAGTGKTTLLCSAIGRLIEQGNEPQSILGLTFSKDAANNMNQRLEQAGICGVKCQTLHAWALQLVMKHWAKLGFTLCPRPRPKVRGKRGKASKNGIISHVCKQTGVDYSVLKQTVYARNNGLGSKPSTRNDSDDGELEKAVDLAISKIQVMQNERRERNDLH